MSVLQKLIKGMPEFLQFPLLKGLYLLKGNNLKSIKSYHRKLYIYEVGNYFVPSESIGWFVTFDYYHKWVEKLSAWIYKPGNGDIILDIGAGLGEESLVFSTMAGGKGKVFSIEANPQVFEVLSNVIRLNKADNVKLFNEAISVSNGKVKMNVASNSFLGGSIGGQSGADNQFTVEGIRMDTFIEREKLENIDLLKVNIEGAERFVIESLGPYINRVKNVAISCHDFRYRFDGNDFFRTRELVEAYLRDNNFEIIPDNGDREFDDWVYAVNKINQ